MEWDKSKVWKCPSCMKKRNTCRHVFFCDHVGRVQTLHHSIDLAETCLEEADTDPDLLDCIAKNAYGCGGPTMVEICNGLGDQFEQMARVQDAIGWRRFMEGMICIICTGFRVIIILRLEQV